MSTTKKYSKSITNYVSSDKERRVVLARLEHSSNKKTAAALGIPRRTVDRIMKRVEGRAEEHGESAALKEPRILVMDIETAPMLTYLWSLFQRGFVNHDMQERETYILSWAAKWVGDKEVMSDALCNAPDYKDGYEDDRYMLEGIWGLMDQADFVVAHNGDKFDIKRLNTAFLRAGFRPPAPYRQIDTLKMLKRCFAFDSNRLDYILRTLEGHGKVETGGFDTWRRCMQGDMTAWDKLVEYNEHDVLLLEQLYLRIRAWDKSHPSAAVINPSNHRRCTVCSSENVEETNRHQYTNASAFKVYRCNDCGATMRARQSSLSPEQRENLLMKAR